MLEIFFIVLVIIHALIHVMGFVKAFQLAEMKQLTQPIARSSGLLWLAASVIFIISLIMLIFKIDLWWLTGSAAIIVSQVLIIRNWRDAKFGTVANLIILVPVLISLVNVFPGSYKNIFIKESETGISRYSEQPAVTLKDLEYLPKPVKKYLEYSGAVGRPRIQNFRAEFRARMKPSIDSSWNDAAAVQYEFFDKPARLFYMEMNIYGIPFEGFHAYIGPDAVMKIKAAKVVPVVNASGAEMNKGETVTLFNDMCLLAPASLLDKKIKWESIDEKSVKAQFTNEGNIISAILYFNETGELVNFISNDRKMSSDGITYKSYPWKTPVSDYKNFNGIKIASKGTAVWETESGDFPYGQFTLKNIEYNIKKFR